MRSISTRVCKYQSRIPKSRKNRSSRLYLACSSLPLAALEQGHPQQHKEAQGGRWPMEPDVLEPIGHVDEEQEQDQDQRGAHQPWQFAETRPQSRRQTP